MRSAMKTALLLAALVLVIVAGLALAPSVSPRLACYLSESTSSCPKLELLR